MSHLPRPECNCIACTASRKQRYEHKQTCMCLRCRRIKDGVKVHVIVPRQVMERIEAYTRYLSLPRPDIMREAFELWLKVADHRRAEQERAREGPG